ncbi:MAG: alginate lyase family protein [Puniceicoccales bacterium]
MMRLSALLLLWFVAGCGGREKEALRPENAEEVLLAELAAELNPDVVGLQPFFALWEQGDVGAAEEALLDYFRGRKIPVAALPAPLAVEQATLISGLDAWRGKFTFQGVAGQAVGEDGQIDWQYRGPQESNEWAWFFHRHAFFRDMLLLYQEQGHEEFVDTLQGYLVDWFWKYPPPEGRSFSASWRALEAARRYVDSWLPVYAALRGNPTFGEEAELAVIAGAARHAAYLKENHHFGGNHLVTEMMALATIATVWPEFRDSPDWMKYAVERSLEELERQVYADGAHKELANHYQWIAGSSFQRLYGVLVEAEAEEAAVRILPWMELIWDYYAWVTRPDGTGPLNNDSDLELNAEQLLPLADFYHRPDWLYIATGGEEGERPAGTPSRDFPWAGQVVLRSDWGPQEDWVFFDAGPFGSDHQQQDRLHLSATLKGVNLLVDSGRYVYRDDEWAAYFRGPRAHNVPTFSRYERILPDAESQDPQEGLLDLSGELLSASAWIPLRDRVNGQWSGKHTRKIAMGDGFLWILDRVDLAHPDEVVFRWHFHPDLELVADSGFWTAREGESPVAQWTAASSLPLDVRKVRGQEEGGIEGWYSPQYNQRFANPILIYRSPATSHATFAWLLVAEDAHIQEAILQVSETGSRLELLRDGEATVYTLDWQD